MARRREKKEKKIYFYKIVVTLMLLFLITLILKIAPNYIRNDITDKINLVINNSNITKNLKYEVYIEDDIIYISTKDIANFFDGNIYYDNKYDQIITSSETKLATFKINDKKISVNGSQININAAAMKKDNQFYLPFSEIDKSVYNVETKYIKSTNTVVITSLDRELTYANSSKNNNIKYKPTTLSRTVDKVEKGDNLILIKNEEEIPDGWTKVATENGRIGYVKTSTLVNIDKLRDNLTYTKQIEENISLIWDYFSVYAKAPQRTGKIQGVNVVSPTFFSLKQSGKGEIIENVGTQGENYIEWAHSNGYKVWALVSNDSMKETTSEIINDYYFRQELIENIISVVIKYNLDGINLDFENIYQADKDAYSRLVIELAPRLKELGKVLSVDVTAPDGSADWSLCFDRNVIGKVADYIVFMAYDQHGTSSENAGTVAGYDWVETNLKKFIEREEVNSRKIVLGIPFYTRIWTETQESLDSKVIDMNKTYNAIPDSANIQWLEDVKQNYAEYTQSGKTYKVWIEDEKSIAEKLDLVSKYNLAGAAYWEKDRETEETWKIISEKLEIK